MIWLLWRSEGQQKMCECMSQSVRGLCGGQRRSINVSESFDPLPSLLLFLPTHLNTADVASPPRSADEAERTGCVCGSVCFMLSWFCCKVTYCVCGERVGGGGGDCTILYCTVLCSSVQRLVKVVMYCASCHFTTLLCCGGVHAEFVERTYSGCCTAVTQVLTLKKENIKM